MNRRLLRSAARRSGKKIARLLSEQFADDNLSQVVLWSFPKEDHPAWVAEGLGELDFDEYQSRLWAAQREFESQGYEVRILHATVAEVLEALQRYGIDNTPEGRSVVYAHLYAERLAGGPEPSA